MAEADAKAALRTFLVGAKGIRTAIDPVLGGIVSLLADLREKGLVEAAPVPPLAVRVTAPGCPVVLAAGTSRRQQDAVVPCVVFSVDGRPVHVKLVYHAEAWRWSDSAGAGVDGQTLSSGNMAKVLLALLSSEV